ncbi:MBL fold metallo-hydrolase [Methylopila musalis]|uniref:MBL fold metallo-hydrolase n=1 Tax=Methylopila musalis TaxID=1134781 RepID=A0ABW3Z4G2_9HYPH
MRVRIHRGARQIGGTVVELEHDGRRLLLDCGLPLDGDPDDPGVMPAVDGLAVADDGLLGVVLSHGHRDHWGLLPRARAALPIFMGEATERIFTAAAPFVPGTLTTKASGHLVDGQPLEVGPFAVTPHLVCHSAFDAYELTVDAGGRRLFYSGDIRGHGRKAQLFERLIAQPPSNVDAMLMEGSSIGRLDAASRFPSEGDIESQLFDAIAATEGMALVAASAQNIDRVVSIFRATRRAGRTLVVDLYAAEILHATNRATIPQTSWPDVALFTPQHQRVKIKAEGLFPLLDRHKANRAFPEALAAEPSRFVVLFRGTMLADLVRAGCLSGARAIWPQWDGYLKDERGASLQAALAAASVPLDVIHTSGHASIFDLQRLAAAIRPRALVPIHTFEAGRFPSLFDNVVVRADGEWWEV